MSKVWLITGASRGLGRAFTEEVLKAGHRVVATARNSEQLAEVASRFGENDGVFRWTLRKKRRPSTPLPPRFKPLVASTYLLTTPDTATCVPSKTRRSRTFAHRLKRIYSAPSL